MTRLILAFGLLALMASAATASNPMRLFATNQTCEASVSNLCQKANPKWKNLAGNGCTSVHGGFRANENILETLVKFHLQDSFKFMLMGSHFNRDFMNRVGLHNTYMGYSDELWENGIKLIKYMTKRGAQMDFNQPLKKSFALRSVQPKDFTGEVHSLSVALDLWKKQAGDVTKVIKQAMNKHHEADGQQKYFDPSIYSFMEGEFLSGYTDKIRDVAGHLNVLGKIATNEKTKRMGLHLYDASLKA